MTTDTVDTAGLPLETMLVLSTAHVARHDAYDLPDDDTPAAPDRFGTRIVSLPYGWLVHVPRGNESFALAVGLVEEDLPSVAAAMRLAHTAGASWINFDQDGPTVDELAEHSW